MGTGRSKNPDGDVVIQLESSKLINGKDATGVIHISLNTRLVFPVLYLVFKGKERSKWIVKRDLGNKKALLLGSNPLDEIHTGTSIICNFNYPLFRWDFLEPGQYSVPFNFCIPSHIPSSFKYSVGSTLGHIEYKFHARLLDQSQKKIKNKIEVATYNNDFSHHYNYSIDKEAKLITWCCSDKGYCKIDLMYPDDVYSSSQVAKIFVKVDNTKSSLTVKKIDWRLYYKVILKDDNGFNHIIVSNLIQNDIKVDIVGGSMLIDNSNLEIDVDLPSVANKFDHMYTTKGKLVECVHMIEVFAEMDGWLMCCGDTPAVQSIINIVPELPPLPVIETPSGWNPQVFSLVTVPYDPNYEVISS
jgi:Arrestin (or S-antigen), N-terminal domain